MKRYFLLSLMLVLITGIFAGNKALVIGNAGYPGVTLSSPVADATLMRNALEWQGYSVTFATELDLKQMTAVIDSFMVTLTEADTAIFYYSGHGAHGSGSNNYLLPVDADPSVTDEYDYPSISIHLNALLERLDKAGQSAAILDASRTWEIKDGGKLRLSFVWEGAVSPRQIIITSTGPDRVIANGSLSLSPFTEEFVNQLNSGVSSLNTIVQNICDNLPKQTEYMYFPWNSGLLKEDITFVMEILETPGAPVLKEELEGGGSISW